MSPAFQIDISLEAGDWPPETELLAFADRAFKAASEEAGLSFTDGAEVSLVFTGDDSIATLNQAWRGKSGPTNVLTFPQAEPPAISAVPLLGDIIFADGVMRKEAAELNISFEAHLSHLLVHGLLHIFGYDHENDKDAEEMETLETAILEKLGYDNPYQRP